MNDTLIAMGLALAVVGTGLGVIYTKHLSRGLFFELETLQNQRDDLEIEWALLQLEQSTLATEAVVDHAARTRLRMAVPGQDSLVYIRR